MATIKTITIEYGYTFNLGNYSSIRPAVMLTAELQDDDNVQDTIATLQTCARQEVEAEIDAALTRQGKAPYFAQLRNRTTPSDDIDEAEAMFRQHQQMKEAMK